MKKIKVQICTGTTCFVMGGADLLLLEDVVTETWGKYGVTKELFNEKVDFSGLACSDACHQPDQKPPFALINGTLLPEATIAMLLEQLKPLFFSQMEETDKGGE